MRNRSHSFLMLVVLGLPVVTYLIGLIGLTGCQTENEHTWFRSIGGISNNREHITWGTAHMALPRRATPAYADGISAPSGAQRPSPRAISNELFQQTVSVPDERGLTDWVWQWGQFVGHDISLTEPLAKIPQRWDVAVPSGDPVFDIAGAGNRFLPFVRSVYHGVTGLSRSNPRQQLNQVTSFIDASLVYGSDTSRDTLLRGSSSPYLLSSNDTNQDGEYLLPRNVFAAANCNYGHPQPKDLFLSGDVRTNEVPGLIVLHTIFMREHNRLIRHFSSRFPRADSETLFEYARKWLGAEIQVITFQEFLPALLGPNAVGSGKYDATLDPGITNEFSTVLYRFGHSMIPITLQRVDATGTLLAPISLSESFFDPHRVDSSKDLDAIARGLAAGRAERIDLGIIDPLRNQLFKGTLGQGLDLAALNIQRGRDHGIPDYNAVREAYGLNRVRDFSEITRDAGVQSKLQSLYGSVDNIDSWVGALAEDHVGGTSVGPLFARGIIDAFTRLRDGDRFWFERDPLLTADDVDELKGTRLSDIIRRNSGATQVPDELFLGKSS